MPFWVDWDENIRRETEDLRDKLKSSGMHENDVWDIVQSIENLIEAKISKELQDRKL